MGMEEFEQQINASFKKYEEGDVVTGTVIGVSDTEVTVDLGSYAEAIVPLAELSNDPRFSIKADVQVGDEITATVTGENDEGIIYLSCKQAADVISWDKLKQLMDNKEVVKVKVAETVNAGVVTYLEGIRAFIPASHLALTYVEDTEAYVGRELEVVVIDVKEADKKLVLSAKEVLREKAIADKNSRIAKLQTGLIVTGKVETLAPYGAFVNIGEDLTGLVHISQICGRHIKSPKEVLKLGDEVKVKILEVKDGKISLSIKAVQEQDEVLEDVEEAPFEYSSGEEASTSLASLLKGITL
ncbi:MAG: S1 RNA-binding domain-containing protein [Lachnospiraceae bacterium]|nr:S1 RNA-binding domain-containing protein [Lachnospiraceae bacterium]